ncbi:MAG: leucine-rich repeat domain-containing protein [Flavobacterium sp.]|nr:leucine-rich repeat domain-containing protein [Flavobacterium sp.]
MKKLYFLLLAFSFFSTANAQIVDIPDGFLRAKLLSADTTYRIAKNLTGAYFKIDANNDGQIQESEALNVSYLDVSNGRSSGKISKLTGMEKFTNLTSLDFSYNYISNLDISNLTKLTDLYCYNNEISKLDVSKLTELENLDFSNNYISNLDVSNLIKLTTLWCTYNKISTLNVNNLTKLNWLDCTHNQISNLDVSNLTSLIYLFCSNNQISTLDVGNLTKLTSLDCSFNYISNLDVSKLTNLNGLYCSNNLITTLDITKQTSAFGLNFSNNQLESLLIKNGINNASVLFSGNPNLKYICVDEDELARIQIVVNQYGYTNCQVNSYCSFVPGGTFYTIQGNQKLDSNKNGCDVNDSIMPNLKYNITNGSITGSIISDISGNYFIPVSAGTHTITPKLENPTYFTVLPTTVNVTFPTQTSPYIQNFCITPNGVRPDLEVTLLPLVPARPGFDAKYKLVYKNKGNTIQSGSVNLNFTDAVIDLVGANPVATSQITNTLSWDFTSLQPFETREISFTMNVNSPMETPAVNNGDILGYTATITSSVTDETPADNTFTFNQTVVGSYDPNDKTCLEGSVITPNLIGQYVHYTIRFENTGTFAAENVVVKDMIDLTKFDISTLVATSASHSYTTRISDGNKVEFIFENINLPFDDANNDGYIAFKIKTKPTLVVNDSFSNEASIFFDYNFPIVTNKATSTFKTLGTPDFDFDRYFTVYPNPATTALNITTKESINIGTVNVYNALGQLVLAIPNAEKVSKVDVSNLKSGNYFIQIRTDKGSSSTQFVKE